LNCPEEESNLYFQKTWLLNLKVNGTYGEKFN